MDKEVVELYLDDIIPNRFQPREVFNEEALKELSDSIKEHGIIQPIIVRKIGDKYEIIAGERRYKASTMAGMTKIPAIIRNLDDKEASKVALLENLQRKDLTAIEEARTYQKILELDSMTQEELGRTMGKSQAAIANKMRLLSLPDEVQEALLYDKISERHARSLLNLSTSEEQINMLNKVINNRMTVRELDNEIRIIKGEPPLPAISNDSVIVEEVTENNNDVPSNTPVFGFNDIPSVTEDASEFLEELELIDEPEITVTEVKTEETINQPTSDLKPIDDLLRRATSYTLKDALDDLKNTTARLQTKGFDIKLEEMDFENKYQVVITIEKDKVYSSKWFKTERSKTRLLKCSLSFIAL